MMRRTPGVPLACASALVAAGLLLLAAPAAAESPTPLKDAYLKRFLGKPAPPFSLKDMAGRTTSLSGYRGKVVLLNFWYSACFPCRQETPDLIALYNARKDRGLVILGINTDTILMPGDPGAMLRKFVETYQIPYPVLIADRQMYDDYGRIPIAPVTLLIDRAGTIAQIFWGAFPGSVYESASGPYLEAARP
ncbi:MAG TPA: TlpA disulfide reductase family protein [Candidatus Polarisedimenticolia bacterium]|jgi:peroxiredoxin|nr:TlpA disulfide reductase family protein [Candidatus Polarisedimenticolia bacterium]